VPAAPLPRRPGSSIPEHGAELRGPRALHRPRRRLRRLLQQGGPRGSPPMAGATVSCLSVAESRFTPWPHRFPPATTSWAFAADLPVTPHPRGHTVVVLRGGRSGVVPHPTATPRGHKPGVSGAVTGAPAVRRWCGRCGWGRRSTPRPSTAAPCASPRPRPDPDSTGDRTGDDWGESGPRAVWAFRPNGRTDRLVPGSITILSRKAWVSPLPVCSPALTKVSRR